MFEASKLSRFSTQFPSFNCTGGKLVRGSHLEVALVSCGPILCRPLADILHYPRRIQTTVFPKQPDFDLYNRWITSKLRDVSCDEKERNYSA